MRKLFLLILLAYLQPGLLHADCLKKFCFDSSEHGKFCASNLHGKAYLVDFWASWCPNCVQELTWLNEIEKKFPRSSFGFLALNMDANRADAINFIAQHQLKLDVAFDTEGSQGEECGLTGVPATILIDRHGNLIRRWNGYSQSTQSQILAELEKLRNAK